MYIAPIEKNEKKIIQTKNKWIQINHGIKFTLNSRESKNCQISYS